MAISSAASKKKAKKVATAKPAKAKPKKVEIDPIEEAEVETLLPEISDNSFKLKLSETLQAKIKDLAEDEGLSVEEFLEELIAEGVVVRAFDQWERRQHLRGHNSQMAPNHNSAGNNNPRHKNRNRNNNNNNNRKSNHARYQNLMEDSSSFLEYVRNQEKKGGR